MAHCEKPPLTIVWTRSSTCYLRESVAVFTPAYSNDYGHGVASNDGRERVEADICGVLGRILCRPRPCSIARQCWPLEDSEGAPHGSSAGFPSQRRANCADGCFWTTVRVGSARIGSRPSGTGRVDGHEILVPSV